MVLYFSRSTMAFKGTMRQWPMRPCSRRRATSISIRLLFRPRHLSSKLLSVTPLRVTHIDTNSGTDMLHSRQLNSPQSIQIQEWVECVKSAALIDISERIVLVSLPSFTSLALDMQSIVYLRWNRIAKDNNG